MALDTVAARTPDDIAARSFRDRATLLGALVEIELGVEIDPRRRLNQWIMSPPSARVGSVGGG